MAHRPAAKSENRSCKLALRNQSSSWRPVQQKSWEKKKSSHALVDPISSRCSRALCASCNANLMADRYFPRKKTGGKLHHARPGDELCFQLHFIKFLKGCPRSCSKTRELETVSPPPTLVNLPHQKCPGGGCHAFCVTIIELKNCGDEIRVCIHLSNSHLWSAERAWTPWMARFFPL